MNDGEEPPMKRIRETLMLSDTTLMLSDDVLLNCLARVPRFYYPTLYLVSKRFRSLVNSMELYATRTLLGCTESCLYVCLRLTPDYDLLRWFIIDKRSNSSRKVLVPIPSPNSTMSGVVVVGPHIYAIGGGSEKNPSSKVMVMDSRSQTWREAPSMQVPRVFPSACTLDGKIYVMGGCDHLDPTNWMEVFDTKTQTWEFLQIPSEEICGGSKYLCVGYEGTIYVRSQEKRATYKLHKGRWRRADITMNTVWGYAASPSSFCVIQNVFCRYGGQMIYWYDLKTRLWKSLKGMEGQGWQPKLPLDEKNVKLADHGGKIAILWEEYVVVDEKKIVWCGEIALESLQDGEIRGTLEGVEDLLTSTNLVTLVHALTATVW
ncbi:hypothetical protein CARUB_v10007270mg [Capsella rubella]|uniref:F-box domain-containing protein n=1 Tax=Capsella rubella TaxID=81985 RepID=R0GP90_9BRAS|nr:F-box/kelch-repeat protein At4g23580 [Capsella rubella]EOA18694.1 hypothetical protein CARUB_v10007270mg [Capsella rubella]